MDSRPPVHRRFGGHSARAAAAWLRGVVMFAAGAAGGLAWQHGLFANAALACLAAVWAAAPDRPPPQAVLATVLPPVLHPREVAELRQLRATLDQVPAPLLALSATGLRALNRAARQMFATDDLVPAPDAGLLEAIAAAAAGKRATVKLGNPGGRSHSVSAAVSFGHDGARTLIVLRDVQAEIQEAEAAALRGILAVLAHEIMNALTPVTSLADSAYAMLTDDGPAAIETAREALGIILRRARGLDLFVQGYRRLARVPPPVLCRASATQIVQDAAALFRARWTRSGVELSVSIPAPDIVAAVDAGLVGQALLSLLTNAAEWSLAGAAPARVRLQASRTAHGLTFSVWDSGPGIDPAARQAVFQPFYTTKAEGSGIGLSLARQIAQSHGGALNLVDDGRSGSEFRMTL